MNELATAETIHPLLEIAGSQASLGTRLDALDIATRLLLDQDAWFAIAGVTRHLLADAEPGSVERHWALDIATRIPLLSVRNTLRKIAADAEDPDAEALSEALFKAHDPSQARRLLEEVTQGRDGAFELLATMPLEDAGIAPEEIPSIREGAGIAPDEAPQPLEDAYANTRVWRALALARLGCFEAIDAVLEASVDDVPMFWGNPWTPYDRIAAMRPVPPPMRRHLLDVHAEGRTSEDLGCRIVWAVTGIATATGDPIQEQKEVQSEPPSVETPAAEPTATPQQVFAAHALAESVLASLTPDFLPETGGFGLDALKHLLPNETASFVLSLINRTNHLTAERPPDCPGEILFGNQVLDIVLQLRATEEWPITELFELYAEQLELYSRPYALDSGQLRWVIARAPIERVVAELASWITTNKGAPAWFIAIADTMAGRDGSPWRGAGPDGDHDLAPSALIDDTLEMAAIGPTPKSADAPTITEQRHVHAQIRHEERRRSTFLAGADNVVRCWISLPDPDAGAVANTAIPAVDLPAQGLILNVVLRWKDQTDRGILHLPGDRTARSSECDLHVHVPDDERFVSVEIAFLYRGRAFEVVHVEAFVLPPAEVEQRYHTVEVKVQAAQRQVIELADTNEVDAVMLYGEDRTRINSPDARGPTALRTYTGTSGASFDLKDPDKIIDYLNTELFAAETSLVRRHARLEHTGEVLDVEDSGVLRILRTLARHGAALYNSLGPSFEDPGQRIQLLNQDPREYSPVEFVYDRGFPSDDAKFCEEGLTALESDVDNCLCCPSANKLSANLRDWNPTICPFGFWSLQKIIERRDLPAGEAHAAGRQSFPLPDRRHLAPLDSILFASSYNVQKADQTETWESLQRVVPRANQAASWVEWRSALKSAQHALLLALPHHGVEDGLDYLEIGDEQLPERARRLSRGRLTELYTNPSAHEPGPIVILLGCRTGAASDLGYAAMARRFQQLSTSVVLGTLGQVLGRHAAPVAREIVAQLAAVDDPDADFGTIMRQVRRRMLAQGYLMALCLVALGDAEWRLTPRN